MTIMQLQYFLVICKHGNLSTAAQELYISHQALSKSLHQLENEINQPLFVRSKNGLVLTPIGKILREQALPVVSSFNHLTSTMHKVIGQQISSLNICIFEAGTSFLTFDDILRFQAQYPQYRLEIQEYSFQTCNELLLNGMKDLAITLSPISDAGIINILVNTYERVLIIPKVNPLAKKERVDINNLKDLQFILSMNERDVAKFYSLFESEGLTPDVIQRVPQTYSMFELCSNYGYAGLSSEFSARSLLPRYPDLTKVRFKDNLFPFPVYCSFSSDKSASPILQAFLSFLKISDR